MKNPLNRDDFEIFLEEEVNQHRMYPSDQIWRNIQQEMHGYKKWPALTVITLFVISALVVGTVLIKPTYKTPAYTTGNNAQKAADVATRQKQQADNIQEHFSPEHITQQTIASVKQDIDITDNIQNAFAAYNNNIAEFIPFDNTAGVTATSATPQDNAGANALSNAVSVAAAPNTPAAETKQAVKKDVALAAPAKNNTLITNWMSFVPQANLNLNGHVIPNIPGIKTPMLRAGAGYMFSLFNRTRDSYSSLTLENNFSQPAHKPFTFKPKSHRFDFAFYATPSISYRRIGYGGQKTQTYVSGIPYNANYTVDLGRNIRHKPATGYEVGAAIGYKLNDILTLRGGFQFDMREYDIEAYKQTSTPGTLGTTPGSVPGGLDVSNQTSAGLGASDKVKLQNRYYEIAMPLGIDVRAWKSGKFTWGVATAVQPTYIFDKDPFIITTDYKNYVDGSKLVRNWNVNANIETYLSYTTGQFKWQLGPQFRYQILSTLGGNYPIREHLVDYGVKIGFVKSLP